MDSENNSIIEICFSGVRFLKPIEEFSCPACWKSMKKHIDADGREMWVCNCKEEKDS